MNYNNACIYLDLPVDGEYTINAIKKQYKLMALMYHPDKNPSPDASARFQEIHSAYEFLIKYHETYGNYCDENDSDYYDYDYDYDTNQDETDIDKTTYRWILLSFLKNILKPTKDFESQHKLFYIILQRILNSCESTAMDILYKLDKTTLMKIYEILKMYKHAFHYTKEFINKIEAIITDKVKNDECIILNPTIDDLFQHNVYKITVNDFTYFVPLWHDELIYDNSGNDIIVKCYPILPENMFIDNNNDLHVNVKYKIQDLWNKGMFDLVLGYNKIIKLNPQLLKLTPTQTVIYVKQGISKINTESVYEISKLSDIHLHIKIDI